MIGNKEVMTVAMEFFFFILFLRIGRKKELLVVRNSAFIYSKALGFSSLTPFPLHSFLR